jgi:hypothetical protein
MVSAKLLISFAVVALMAVTGESTVLASDLTESQKIDICAEIRNDSAFRKQSNNVCEKYKFTLPRPRVFNACRTGLNSGEENACRYALKDSTAKDKKMCKNMLKNKDMTSAAQSACAKQWRTAPRPTVGASCQEGFEEAAKRMCEFVEYRLESMGIEEDAVEAEESKQEEVKTAPEPPTETVEQEEVKAAPEPPTETAEITTPEQEPIEEVVPEPVVEDVATETEQVVEETQAKAAEAPVEDLLQDVEDAVERLTEMLDTDEQ